MIPFVNLHPWIKKTLPITQSLCDRVYIKAWQIHGYKTLNDANTVTSPLTSPTTSSSCSVTTSAPAPLPSPNQFDDGATPDPNTDVPWGLPTFTHIECLYASLKRGIVPKNIIESIAQDEGETDLTRQLLEKRLAFSYIHEDVDKQLFATPQQWYYIPFLCTEFLLGEPPVHDEDRRRHILTVGLRTINMSEVLPWVAFYFHVYNRGAVVKKHNLTLWAEGFDDFEIRATIWPGKKECEFYIYRYPGKPGPLRFIRDEMEDARSLCRSCMNINRVVKQIFITPPRTPSPARSGSDSSMPSLESEDSNSDSES